MSVQVHRFDKHISLLSTGGGGVLYMRGTQRDVGTLRTSHSVLL